ncbi:MAG: phosphoribosylformylglycinamidine cyclo-ligase [Planctomycetes bacterium]|nr:phosphoribosylformylglycinamidine cyclo-ligase [Planctomycetota bacterium]
MTSKNGQAKSRVTPLTYKNAGVDVAANTRWVGAIESAMRSTYGPRVFKNRHGGFSGLFRLDYDEQLFRRNYRKPVLVGCTDGVGTKILLAIEMKRLSTIGIDLVAMNVNDLITCGAEPLFFLDYLAVHKLEPAHLQDVIEGVADGCRQAGCALLGGETAEMPDLYKRGDFDLAGFAVGVVEYRQAIDSTRVSPGDVIIGLPSSGVHSNGYTLVRKLIRRKRCKLDQVHDELGESLGDALLRPTRIYVNAVQAVQNAYAVKRVVTGMAHITGGGLCENIARAIPSDCDAVLRKSSWKAPPIFDFLRRLGVKQNEMFKVFNMGIGFILTVRPFFATGVMGALRRAGEQPVKIGRVRRGRGQVIIR